MDFEQRTRRRLEEAIRQVVMSPVPRAARYERTIHRRSLIQQAKLLAARYSLQEHLEADVYATGHAALTGLDVDQLEQLVAHLELMGSRLDVACDPPGAPPAR